MASCDRVDKRDYKLSCWSLCYDFRELDSTGSRECLGQVVDISQYRLSMTTIRLANKLALVVLNRQWLA